MNMFCSQCGRKLGATARFCSQCGASVSGESAPTENRRDENQQGKEAEKNLVFTVTPFGGLIIAAIMCAVVFVFFQIGRSHLSDSDSELHEPVPASDTRVDANAGSGISSRGDGGEATAPSAEPDPRIEAVGARFYCKCGSCDGSDLISDCGCDHPRGAQEVMSFIAKGFAANLAESAVISAVNSQYPGYMR